MKLSIARMGHPILQQRADEVADVASPVIQKLIADMIETCQDLSGAGLAAPQVFQPLRIVMFEVPDERASLRGMTEGVPLTVLINPEIEPLTEEMELAWEGCFSIPGMMGEVPRYRAIRYSGLTAEGQRIVREVDGFHARVVQHECDHLNGILYPMHLRDLKRFGFVDEIKQTLMTS